MSMLLGGIGVCVMTDPNGNITQITEVNGEPVPRGNIAEIKMALCYLPEIHAELVKLPGFRIIPMRSYSQLWREELTNRVGVWASLPVVTDELWRTIYNRSIQMLEASMVVDEIYRETGDWNLSVKSSPKRHPKEGNLFDKVAKFCGFPSDDIMVHCLTSEQILMLESMREDLHAGRPVYPK